MSSTKRNNAIAYLLYAIAAADRKVKTKELQALEATLQEHWPEEEAEAISRMVEGILQHGLEALEAYKHFEQAFQEQTDLFPEAMRQRIFTAADEVASAFAGKNKSELVLLSKLQLLFTQS